MGNQDQCTVIPAHPGFFVLRYVVFNDEPYDQGEVERSPVVAWAIPPVSTSDLSGDTVLWALSMSGDHLSAYFLCPDLLVRNSHGDVRTLDQWLAMEKHNEKCMRESAGLDLA